MFDFRPGIEHYLREEFICSLVGGYIVSRRDAVEMVETAKQRGVAYSIVDKGNPYFVILQMPKSEPWEPKPEDYILKGCNQIPETVVDGEEITIPVKD